MRAGGTQTDFDIALHFFQQGVGTVVCHTSLLEEKHIYCTEAE